ncbi:patatin-like phospholipase family protein [Dactylosporangium sp. NPDC000555]|uniref:patatin-like phospholipase family protein n=1 Tax=Dactylosporangium sp. NPDC000555 TaxID=3154260 RepID=UPI0033207677
MPYADLVLEGGGVKGIALVGAISVLEERGYEFKRVAGTSAGAVVGSLVAANIPATRLTQIMRKVDYRAFQDADWAERFAVGKAFGLVFDQGIFHGNYLRAWLAEQLNAAGVRTFGDLPYSDPDRPLPPQRRYRLVVMASDISQGCLRRLPWDLEHYRRERARDDEFIVDSVRASMSIPFFYTPEHWQTTDGQDSWLVDGGMLSNYPIDVFDAEPGHRPRWPTLGIKLSARQDAAQGIVNPITGIASMSIAMLKTLTGFYDRMHIESQDAVDRTIFVDTGHVRATDFELDAASQNMLFQNGRKAAREFLDGTADRPAWDFDAYIAKHRAVPARAR